MIDKEQAELIDDFLLGRLQGDRLDRFILLRKSDHEFDTEVRHSIEAFIVLQYARYKQLREKLHQIDASSATPGKRSFFTPRVLVFILIVLFLFGTWCWATEYYSPTSLALRFYDPDSTTIVWIGNAHAEDAQIWAEACKSIRDKNFQSAINLFQLYTYDPDYRIALYSRWNILLARLGEEGPTSNWIEELQQFETNAPEPFKAKAHKLLGITDSALYRFFVLHLTVKLSAFKPQLM